MIRTSESHPLWIDAVDAGPGRGSIGITFAPGKHDRHAIGCPWARDLTSPGRFQPLPPPQPRSSRESVGALSEFEYHAGHGRSGAVLDDQG
jgi:hypothetical protein